MAIGPTRLYSSRDAPMTTSKVPPGTVMTKETRAGMPQKWVVGPDGSLLKVSGKSVEQTYHDAASKIDQQLDAGATLGELRPMGAPQNLYMGGQGDSPGAAIRARQHVDEGDNMARNRDNQSSEQQWNFHVWGNPYEASPYATERIATSLPLRTRDQLEVATDILGSARGRSNAMVDLQVQAAQADQARGGTGAPMGGPDMIGRQQFDGDSIAWKSYLGHYARQTGPGWSPMQDRTQRQMIANASRIDAARRSDYLRYIEAGGTSGYNDWLIENDLHARQGGW